MRRTVLWAALASAGLLIGCGTEPADYGDPTSLLTESTQNGIVLEVLSPVRSFSTEPTVDLQLRVARVGSAGSGGLVVLVGTEGGVLLPAAEVDATLGRFGRRLSLEHGRNVVVVEVRDVDGRLLRDARFVLRYEGTLPGLAVVALGRPVDGRCDAPEALSTPITNSAELCVVGRATESGTRPIVAIAVESGQGRVESELTADRRFAVAVPLESNALNTLRVVATDSEGLASAATVEVMHDDIPPTLVLREPSTPSVTTDRASIAVAGTVNDEHGIDALRLETGNAGVTYLPPEPAFTVDVRLETGANVVRIVATDRAGNEAVAALDVVRDRVIRLGVSDDARRTATLRLDRTALEALIAPEERAGIDLVAIPIRGTIRSALTRLADPEAFGIDTSTWGAAEFNLQRLMVTSPDTADLSGSSLEELLRLSQGIGLPAPRLIAQLVDVGVSEPLLTTDVLTDVFLENLVATHPAVARNDAGEPVLEVTLADALNGLTDLGTRFGPAGEHPGFVVGETRSTMLEPGFAMSIDATTNLLERQGVDASDAEKDFLYVRQGDRVLTFDFVDSSAFSVVGLVNEPTIDLRIGILESDAFFAIGRTRDARPDGATGAFRGDSAVWDEPPWVLEALIAEAVFASSRDRFADTGYRRTLRYSAGAVENAATMDWERGWISIATSGGLGDPPPPFYAWDLLLEVAQLRLHDGGLAEGEADVEFVLRDLPVGVTATELVEALRPTLQAQEAELSELLLGTSGIADSGCDFYLVPSDDGDDPWLTFREAADVPGSAEYPRVGFYADLALSEALSQRVVASGSSDTTHHKVRARAGLDAFFSDDSGRVYRLRVLRSDPRTADVIVTPVEGT